MRLRRLVLLTILVALTIVTSLQAQKIKVIVDQDARGPATTDMQSILIFLQSDKFDVLGITTVSGDQWVKEETQHTLRLLEIAVIRFRRYLSIDVAATISEIGVAVLLGQ